LQQPVFTVDRRRPAFDPLVLLTIVNRLQPLGKEKILALAERCVGDRRHDDDASVTLGLALLVLFEVPADPGFLPGLAILDTWPYRSSNRMESPRYPIAVVGDVPILLAREASGFGVHGIGPSRTVVQSLYYPRFRVREHPLVPKDDPFELVAMLKKTAPWFFEPVALRDGLWTPESGPWYPPRSGPQSGEKAVARQVLSLIGATIDPRPDVGEWGDEEFDKRWASARNTFLALQPRWDAKRGMFTISRQTRKVPSARDSRQSE
jgi:hypothetical protein